MRGNEVFENGKAVSETRFHGDLDLFTLRIDHESAHTGKLFDLVDRAAGAGIRHHPDGVELIFFALLFEESRHLIRRGIPLRDNGEVSLLFVQKTSGVFLGDLGNFRFRVVDDVFLFGRNLHIENGGGKRRQSGILIPSLLDGVEDIGGLGRRARLEAGFDDTGEMFLSDRARAADKLGVEFESEIGFGRISLDEAEILRQTVVVDQTADGRLDDAAHFAPARFGIEAHRRFLDQHRFLFVEIGVVDRAGIRQGQIVELALGKFHDAL